MSVSLLYEKITDRLNRGNTRGQMFATWQSVWPKLLKTTEADIHNHNMVMPSPGDGCITSALLSRERHFFLCHSVQCMQDSSHCYMERVFMSSPSLSIAKRNQTNKGHCLFYVRNGYDTPLSVVTYMFVAEFISFMY